MRLSETSSTLLISDVESYVVEARTICFVLRLSEVTKTFESEFNAMDSLTIVSYHHVDCW